MENNAAKKSSKKKIIIGVVILIIAAIALFGIYKNFMPTGQVGDKEITVVVVHGDKSEKDFVYQTDEAYLRPVVEDEGLVKGSESEFGLFITTVDGETADSSKEQWWCITKSGEMINTSVDDAPIADGDTYEFTLIEGY